MSNPRPKFCIDCTHYTVIPGLLSAMCDRSEHDLVDDQPTVSCWQRRNEEHECGTAGKDFEPYGIDRRPGRLTHIDSQGRPSRR